MNAPQISFVCSYCGYHPGNRASWCDLGCGRDYNEMFAVPTKAVNAIIHGEKMRQRPAVPVVETQEGLTSSQKRTR